MAEMTLERSLTLLLENPFISLSGFQITLQHFCKNMLLNVSFYLYFRYDCTENSISFFFFFSIKPLMEDEKITEKVNY